MEYWNRAFRRNRELSNASSSANLVLYGDARIEHWLGTHSGVPKEHHEGTRGVYQQLFNTTDDSSSSASAVRGVPLGIAGDGCSQLLFRLQNGELPASLQPRVIWVLIGSVDLDALCSVGTIVTGSIAVVRYLQHARPNAIVVMNSLLPWLSGSGETTEEAVSLHDTPIWQKTQQVNHQLECWAQSQTPSVDGSGGIEFFNATPFFLNEAGTHVDPDLMESFEYPTAAGALKWGQGILDRVQELLTNL